MQDVKAPRGVPLPFLAEWRRARLMTQRDLVKVAGVSQSSISQLETGEHTARIATIKKLAKALKVTPERLINGGPSQRSA